MSKIREAFENKKAFIGFLTAGDPTLEKTEEFIVEMEKAGAAIIQIGIPFSDPVAEEVAVQEANVRALSVPGDCTTDMIFAMAARVRQKVSVPLVLQTYLNPVFKYGYEAFCKRCSETGISGIIIPDMPYEERGELVEIAGKRDVDIISIIAPADENRIQMIAKEARGYIYVAASGEAESEDIGQIVKVIRKVTDVPVAVGHGVCKPEQAAKYAALSDGVIVGSAITEIIGRYGSEAGKPVYEYIKSMVDKEQIIK